jgi:nucleotide-binding universal stress UspA family protein
MYHRIRTILAGVSVPAADDDTLVAAAELARWTGATLHLVHSLVPPVMLGSGESLYATPGWLEDFLAGQRAALERAAASIPGVTTVCHTVVGASARAILDTAAEVDADLVVVGAARRGRLARAFLGTTAQRVLRGASIPVLALRAPLRRPLERVLLTTDLSKLSAAVHEAGLDTLSALFGASGAARSLLVLSFPLFPAPLPRESVDRAARAELEAFLRGRRTRAQSIDPAVRVGVPGEEIAAEAEAWDADVVVVGTHARGWADRALLGSVAEAALRDAPCNVLAVPPRAAALRDVLVARSPAEAETAATTT